MRWWIGWMGSWRGLWSVRCARWCPGAAGAGRLDDTVFAQAGLFAVEVALAALLAVVGDAAGFRGGSFDW